MLVKVNGTEFKRDTTTMALINNDANGLNEYLSKRKLVSTQKQEINIIRSEMDVIKSDIAEMKYLLRKLLEKDSNG